MDPDSGSAEVNLNTHMGSCYKLYSVCVTHLPSRRPCLDSARTRVMYLLESRATSEYLRELHSINKQTNKQFNHKTEHLSVDGGS